MNPERGEVEIELTGRKFVMRPSYTALMEIERTTGIGLVPLARRIINLEYGLGDAVAVITAGLRAKGEGASPEKVGSMVMETGLLIVGPALVKFMTNALRGGDDEPGEVKAADQTSSSSDDPPPSPTQP